MRFLLAILFLLPTFGLADFQYPEDCLKGFDPNPDPTNCSLNRLNNGEPADAEKVMENFYTLGDAIDAVPALPRDCTTNQIIKWDGSAWVCSTADELPIRGWYYTPALSGEGGRIIHKLHWQSRSRNATLTLENGSDDLFCIFEDLSKIRYNGCYIALSNVNNYEGCSAEVFLNAGSVKALYDETAAFVDPSYAYVAFNDDIAFGQPMKLVLSCPPVQEIE